MSTATREGTFLYEVRCSCCKCVLGVTQSVKWGVYCDEFDAQDVPPGEHEGRDAIIEALMWDTELPLAQIGNLFGLARQRMYQLAKERDLSKA